MLKVITKTNITEIISEIELNLALLGQYYGLEFVLSRKRYSDVTISFAVEGFIKDSPEVAKMFDIKLSSLGLPLDTIGSKVRVESNIYTVTSVDSKKRTYPVTIKDSIGHPYRISVLSYKNSRI